MEAPIPFISKINKIVNFKEFYNFGEYYLKLSFNDIEELNIICYNIVKLDGICYEVKINIQQIYSINNVFRQFTHIKDIYELILDLIKDNKISLSFNPEQNLIFSFIITDIKRNNQKVELILVHNSNNNTKEYNNILSKEIINLRNTINNNNEEIKELKEEIKAIKDLISQSNINKNVGKNITNITKKNAEKECLYCGMKKDLKKCICNKYYCDKCISNNKNINCQKNCYIFNNNLNTLTSYYQISKLPLPKNFEANIHFNKVDMIRFGITFDPNIIKEKSYGIDSPPYDIYYLGRSLTNVYAYEKGWINRCFRAERKLKDGDNLILKVKNGKLSYLLNGNSIGDPFELNKDKLNDKKMFLLIHRRDDISECQLKYIYELID